MAMSNAEKCSLYYRRHKEERLQYAKRYYYHNSDRCKSNVSSYRDNHPLVSVHIGMLRRCGFYSGANETSVRCYILRHIKVCEAWLSFPVFEKWAIEHGWRKGLQIDRIDNAKGYSPENCRIVTPRENSWNKRNNKVVVYKGKKIRLLKLHAEMKCTIPYGTVYQRIIKGYSVEDSMSIPLPHRAKYPEDLNDLVKEVALYGIVKVGKKYGVSGAAIGYKVRNFKRRKLENAEQENKETV